MPISFTNILSFPAVACTEIMGFLCQPDNRPIEEQHYRKKLESNQTIEDIVYDVFARIVIENTVTSVIFLETDGVIFSYQNRFNDLTTARQIYHKIHETLFHAESNAYRFRGATYFFNQRALSHLKKITQSNDVAIVLSSARRHKIPVSKLREICKASFGNLIIDKTAEGKDREYLKRWACRLKLPLSSKQLLEKASSRSAKILDWLERYPGVQNYVIFDKYNAQMLEVFRERFVYVDPKTLLTKGDVYNAIHLFRPINRR